MSNEPAEVNSSGNVNSSKKQYDLSSSEPLEINPSQVDKPVESAFESEQFGAVKPKSSSSFNLNKAMASSSKSSGASKDSDSKLSDDDIDEFFNS